MQNLNRGSKKTDFSIVEQKVDPQEIFSNLSECDLRGDQPTGECQRCTQLEKLYLKSESKYMKTKDRMLQVQTDLELTNQELDELHS